jgi:hypothetical protein
MRAVRAIMCSAIALAGCGGGKSGDTSRLPATDRESFRAPPAESLALRLPNGYSIWLTGSRSDTDSTGRPCIERVMQIRHDSLRIAIPLLYTGTSPTAVDDTTIAADLWLRCRAGDRYLVDLRTGRPRRALR